MLMIFDENRASPHRPKEGEFYRSVVIAGKIFELYYGYYEEFEREYNAPMPIYPDLKKEPLYTDNGTPVVTAIQDACNHYQGNPDGETCFECKYFLKQEELFGYCQCPHNKYKSNAV